MNQNNSISGIHRTSSTSDYVIIPMEEQHVDRVVDIWSNRLGAPEDRMENWISHVLDENRITEGFVASSGGYVVGFAIVTVGGDAYLNEYLSHPDSSVDVWSRTGICEAIAVDEAHEGRGIGTDLGKAQLQYFQLCEVAGVVAVSWHRDNHHDSRALFETLGFDAAEVHDDYYARLSEDVYCIDCDGSCTCGATVFIKQICSGEQGGATA